MLRDLRAECPRPQASKPRSSHPLPYARTIPEAAHPTSAPPELTAPGEVRVRRALLSVSDKRGIVDFARGLADLGVIHLTGH